MLQRILQQITWLTLALTICAAIGVPWPTDFSASGISRAVESRVKALEKSVQEKLPQSWNRRF